MDRRLPIIAALGDSLFEGWGLASGGDAPTALAEMLAAKGRAVTMLNHGVSGDTAGDGLRRLGRVRAAEPDLALVQFGANDFYQGVDPERMDEQLSAIISALQGDGCSVILVGARCLSEYTGEEYAARYAPVHSRVAERFSVPLVPDIFAAYLHDPDLVQPDGLHPTASGTRAIAVLLLPHVLKAVDALESKRLDETGRSA